MEIFGVGPAELVLILIIVVIIFGPDQLPEIAKKLGAGVREIRHTLDSISSEVDETVKPLKDLADPSQPLKELIDFNQPIKPNPDTPPASNLIVADEAEIMDQQPAPANSAPENGNHTLTAGEGGTIDQVASEAEASGDNLPAPAPESIEQVHPMSEPPRDDSTQP